MNNPRPATCTPAELLQWREIGSLELSPKFQRRSVWTPQQRSYLIDTLLRVMPVPSIYLRNIYLPDKKKLVHEVIDGQQRLRAVLDFVDDKFALTKSLEADYAGKRFSALPKKQQELIMKFTFNYQAFDAISDQEVYDVFRRMNTFSSPLTKQELRHGQYFGYFSRTCEALAGEHLEFWRGNRIIPEKLIARMGEVQFTSSLLIAQMDGVQNKNEKINHFYADYDDKFPGRKNYEKRFRETIDAIVEAVGDALKETQFRRPPFFYSLFCTVYHRMFGLPKIRLKTPKKPLSDGEKTSLSESVSRLSEVLLKVRESMKQQRALDYAKNDKAPPGAPYPPKLHGFIVASLSGTDNALPRETRLKTLYTETFG